MRPGAVPIFLRTEMPFGMTLFSSKLSNRRKGTTRTGLALHLQNTSSDPGLQGGSCAVVTEQASGGEENSRRLGEAVHRVHSQTFNGGQIMARGDKSAYTNKQKRKAEHIAEGYE